MDYRKHFYKKYVSTHVREMYGERSLEKINQEFPVWEKFFGRFLPKDKDARILDLGCGDGGLVYWLRLRGFVNVEGVDVGEEQIKGAKQLGISGVMLGDALSFLREKKNLYVTIVARDFLEHFTKEEIVELMPAVFESLRDGGVFIVQTINAENLLGSRLRHADFTHETVFTQDSIRQLLRVFGFSDVEVYPMRPVVKGLASLFRYCLWKLIECGFHAYLIIATGYYKGIFTQDILCVAKK